MLFCKPYPIQGTPFANPTLFQKSFFLLFPLQCFAKASVLPEREGGKKGRGEGGGGGAEKNGKGVLKPVPG